MYVLVNKFDYFDSGPVFRSSKKNIDIHTSIFPGVALATGTGLLLAESLCDEGCE